MRLLTLAVHLLVRLTIRRRGLVVRVHVVGSVLGQRLSRTWRRRVLSLLLVGNWRQLDGTRARVV